MSYIIALAALIYVVRSMRAAYLQRRLDKAGERSFAVGAGLIPRK